MRSKQMCPQTGRGLPGDSEEREEQREHRHRSQMDRVHGPTLTLGKFLNFLNGEVG